MALSLLRTHKGEIVLHVNGQPASAAKFNGISTSIDGSQHAVFAIPLVNTVWGETDNVVPFRSREPIPVSMVGEEPRIPR